MGEAFHPSQLSKWKNFFFPKWQKIFFFRPQKCSFLWTRKTVFFLLNGNWRGKFYFHWSQKNTFLGNLEKYFGLPPELFSEIFSEFSLESILDSIIETKRPKMNHLTNNILTIGKVRNDWLGWGLSDQTCTISFLNFLQKEFFKSMSKVFIQTFLSFAFS